MANRTFNDLTGTRFGRLVVLSRASRPGFAKNASVRWLCRCDCGTEKVVRSYCLRSSRSPTLSCGCLRRERVAASVRTHGAYLTPEYRIWCGMLGRCHNPRNTAYADYGGRGIVVCDRWRDDFRAFRADVGPRPTPKHTIERVDNDGPYAPENCRWATRFEQQKNRRRARLITHNGRTETAHMWSRITGIPSRTITNRLNAGWPPERVLSAERRKTGFGARVAQE